MRFSRGSSANRRDEGSWERKRIQDEILQIQSSRDHKIFRRAGLQGLPITSSLMVYIKQMDKESRNGSELGRYLRRSQGPIQERASVITQ